MLRTNRNQDFIPGVETVLTKIDLSHQNGQVRKKDPCYDDG